MNINNECSSIKAMIKFYYSINNNSLNEIDEKIMLTLEELNIEDENYTTSLLTILNEFYKNVNQKISQKYPLPITNYGNDKKELKESTIAVYDLNIKKLLAHNIIINPLSLSIDELCETIITKFKIAQSSLKTYLSAIVYYSRINNVNLEKLPEICNKIKSIYTLCENNYRNNTMSLKEEEQFITWDNVILIHKELETQYNLDKFNTRLHTYYLILSYYVYMPPRRLLDYATLYYDNNQELDISRLVKLNGPIPNNKSTLVIPTDEKNYYIQKDNKGYFIFNKYKTNDNYSSQYFEIHPKLNDILQNYISQHNIEMGNPIMNYSSTNFGIKIKNIFKCYANKSLGASGLRHIYIIYQKDNGNLKTGSMQDKIAFMMAHSINDQQNYYKITDNTVFDFVLNKDGYKELCKPHGKVKLVETPEMKKIRIKANKERYINKKNAEKEAKKIIS